MVLGGLFKTKKDKAREEAAEHKRLGEEAAERHRLAEEAAWHESFLHSPLLQDPLDAVGTSRPTHARACGRLRCLGGSFFLTVCAVRVRTEMLAVFGAMEEAGDLAERWEADGVLHHRISFQNLIDAVQQCDLSFSEVQALELFRAHTPAVCPRLVCLDLFLERLLCGGRGHGRRR